MARSPNPTNAFRVLIVEPNPDLARAWREALVLAGAETHSATTESAAEMYLRRETFEALILNVELARGSALAVADIASFRQPDCALVFVTGKAEFSDGTLLRYYPSACAILPSATPVADLVALVEHHALRRP